MCVYEMRNLRILDLASYLGTVLLALLVAISASNF